MLRTKTNKIYKLITQTNIWIDKASFFQLSVVLFFFSFFVHTVYALGHNTFLQDSARDILIAENHLANQELIVNYGPKASVGNFYLPPFYYQLHLIVTGLVPFFPLAMRWVILFVESFTPVMIFLLLTLFIPKRSAFFISLLYVLFHQVLIYSTQSWNPNMIPFFTTSFLVCWLYYIKNHDYGLIYLALFALAISLHLHYQTFILLPFALIVWTFSFIKFKTARKHLLLSPWVAAIPFLPYLWAEITNSFINTQAIITFFSQEHVLYYDRVSKPAYVLTYFPSFMERLIFSKEMPLHFIGSLLFFGGFSIALIKSKNNIILRWLLFYFGMAFVMLRVFKGDKLDYYLMTLFILPTFLLACYRLISTRLTVILGSIMLILILWYLPTLKTHNFYRDLKQIVSFIEIKSPTQDIQVVFHDLSNANYLYYGLLKFSNLSIVPASTTLVDLCPSYEAQCAWDGIAMCKPGTPDDEEVFWYALDAKYHNDYKVISYKKIDDKFQVAIGQVNQPRSLLNHPQQHDASWYGSDFLIPL